MRPPTGPTLFPYTTLFRSVQGAGAAAEIASAIGTANAHAKVDALIVCRGGGSIEDLWAFNEERVAQAIFDSRIPIVSGRSEEHTSELQSPMYLVCRLLLEK